MVRVSFLLVPFLFSTLSFADFDTAVAELTHENFEIRIKAQAELDQNRRQWREKILEQLKVEIHPEVKRFLNTLAEKLTPRGCWSAASTLASQTEPFQKAITYTAGRLIEKLVQSPTLLKHRFKDPYLEEADLLRHETQRFSNLKYLGRDKNFDGFFFNQGGLDFSVTLKSGSLVFRSPFYTLNWGSLISEYEGFQCEDKKISPNELATMPPLQIQISFGFHCDGIQEITHLPIYYLGPSMGIGEGSHHAGETLHSELLRRLGLQAPKHLGLNGDLVPKNAAEKLMLWCTKNDEDS